MKRAALIVMASMLTLAVAQADEPAVKIGGIEDLSCPTGRRAADSGHRPRLDGRAAPLAMVLEASLGGY